MNILLKFHQHLLEDISRKSLHFFYKKSFYKKMNLENPKTLRKCSENLQPQIPELQFSETPNFLRAL